ATDFDPAMVRTAARRLQAYPEVTVRGADATDLPFSADSFDSVLSCLMLHHIVEWERAIAEIARVLRPGGSLVLVDRFSPWLVPTLAVGRGGRARTRHRAEKLLLQAGFQSPKWQRLYAVIINAVTANKPV
ncbi:class I SAM-dependent methyltransferase, partial [Mycobacterium kansasii]